MVFLLIGGRIAATIIWMMAIALILVKTNRSARIVYRLQALGEAGLGALAAWHSVGDLWISVGLVLVFKLGVIPELMRRNALIIKHDYGAKGPVGMTAILMIIFGVTVVGLFVANVFHFLHPILSGVLLAAWIISYIHLSGRYETWSIGWGLLSLDTISSSLVGTWAGVLPASADIATTGVAVALAGLIAIFSGRIALLRHTTDVRQVKELIG